MQISRSGIFYLSIAVFGLWVFGALDVQGQLQPVQYDERNPYHVALQSYLSESERVYSSVIPERDFTTAIIVKNESVSDALPTEIGRYKIIYLDKAEVLSRVKKLSRPKEIVVGEIRPLKFEADQLIVSIGEYVASSRESRLVLALSGGIRVSFLYSCSARSWIVQERKLFSV